jgi:hypothetical protein
VSSTAARELAKELLGDLPGRWRHTEGVVRRAGQVSVTIGDDDPDVLIAAAWLHDIGYAEPLRDTGFHPLDGGRYLRGHGWPDRLAALVANHSGARYTAEVRGLSLAEFPQEVSPLADALTYADQTTGPDGRPMTVPERVADMLKRHGPHSPNARAQPQRGPYLLAVAGRVEARLRQRE